MTSDTYPRFRLGHELSDEQLSFFDENGFLHFEGFASRDEVEELRAAHETMQTELVDRRPKYINGIPVRYGTGLGGRTIVQRSPFTSQRSDTFKRFINDARFEPIRRLVGGNARVGENEKDGLVVNHYVNVPGSRYRQLGWHTDGLRDIFLHWRLPGPMLNIGFNLDDSMRDKGGLRVIPGSHKQGIWAMAFAKLQFLDNRPDPREICVEAKAGDLTIHDGRLWHRVARCPIQGPRSQRRVMYVPFINGPYEPKHAASPVPIYHRFGWLIG